MIPVFDIGGVLLDFDEAHLYRKIFADEAAMRDFFERVLTRQWWVENLDHGRPCADAVAELTLRHPEFSREIQAADERWLEMIGSVIDGSRLLLQTLKNAGIPIYSITNFPHEKFYLARERYPFLNWFDGVVISGEEQVVKPAPEIYNILLDRYGLSAQDCLFIDDSMANIAAARTVGMQAHHFQNPESLRECLQSNGLL